MRDPALSGSATLLRDAIAQAADSIGPNGFSQLVTPLMASVLQRCYQDAGAHAGAIWLVDPGEKCLVPIHARGSRTEVIVGDFRQPLSSGIISMVFSKGQPFCENNISGQSGHSPMLDELLEVETRAMIAVPLHFAGQTRGVTSCVQLAPRGEPSHAAPFTVENLSEMELATATIQRLLEMRLLEHLLEWNER